MTIHRFTMLAAPGKPILALVILALSAAALATDDFTITQKPKVGDSYRYAMKADIDLGGNPIPLTATLTEKIVKVDTDGSFTLESAQVQAKISFNGKDQDLDNGNPADVIYKPSGEVLKVVGDTTQATPQSYRMANLTMIFDPGKPLAVNDTWSHELKADPTTGAVAVHADYKLLGEEKVGAIDTLKIQVTTKETGVDTPGSSEGTVWIDKTNGAMVKVEEKWTNVPVPGLSVPVSATVHIDRVVAS